MNRSERIALLKSELSKRVLVLDGAMGTMIQGYDLKAQDFGGEETEGCNEFLVITRPEIIFDIHKKYLEAGADIIETNTFGGTPLVLNEFGLGARAAEINRVAAEIARKAADSFSDKPRFVAGSIGPTTKALSVTGGATFEELVEHFRDQAQALYEGGVDYFLIETSQDTRNIKAALKGIDMAQAQYDIKIPIAVSGTIEPMGTMLAGQSAEALAVSLMHRDLLYLGLNCATGPEFMTEPIRALSELAPFAIACVPNAGLPDEDGHYLETPAMMARVLKNFGDRGWLNLIGGCCGTTYDHIKAFSEMALSLKPRAIKPQSRSLLSGIDWIEINESNRPVFVGERTNVIGSRKFKELICEEKWDEASDIARRQIKNAAQIIDICLANPDRDEFSDMKHFLELLVKKITAPLMIDSTDARVIEMALTYSQGKAIINSVNLEDGEERFEHICPLARSYGAALVVGLIDDDPQQGMGVKLERKLEIARRSYDLLTRKYGIPPEDIYWDALVFPCGTGDPQYSGSGVETIEGVRALKQEFPKTKTVLGISNISFGLPSAGREVLNSVFLYHCTQAGLDLPIVNTEKLERYAEIPVEEIKLCDDLLWNRGPDPIAAFAAHFGTKKTKVRLPKESLSLDERLSRAIIEGSKEGLFDDLSEAMKERKPLEIINGPLMAGMDEVGRLFNANKLIVAEVLQSAEAMKAAVDHLKPFMEKSDSSLRGRVVLATVKGDVHDIGKNLVEIILSNNGFEVINLGIKIPSQTLIEAVRKYNPQIVGLSGLLVKSAQMMVETAGDLAAVGIQTPILVGGAALTRNFVDRKIAPAYGGALVEYANDAMDGLELSKQIVDEKNCKLLVQKVAERRVKLAASAPSVSVGEKILKPTTIAPQENPPQPPDWKRHVVTLPLETVWSYVNPLMLLGKHLGVKGGAIRALTSSEAEKAALLSGDASVADDLRKAKEIAALLDDVKREVRPWISAKAVYQFFPAWSEGEVLKVDAAQLISWTFRRQREGEGLCLSDFVRSAAAFSGSSPNGNNSPPGADNIAVDNIALFVTSCQGPVRETAERWKNEGQFLKSHILLSLALETAEASAEYLHALIRAQWGFADSLEMSMMERFQARYRGKRYSFGYPACPDLEFQKELFEALKPEEMGVKLTEGFMMSPEASVSALVFSHPQAKYFGVGSDI